MSNYFLAAVPKKLKENKEIVRLVSKFKRTLSDQDKEVRWVQPALWHVTLQFFGPLDLEQKTQVLETLKNWAIPASLKNLSIRIQGVGAFSEIQHARVLWFGVQNSVPLNHAKEELNTMFEPLGFKDEHSEFVPHITIGRFRNPMNISELVNMGKHKFFGDYEISELVLIESVIQNHMAKYVPVESFSLTDSCATSDPLDVKEKFMP